MGEGGLKLRISRHCTHTLADGTTYHLVTCRSRDEGRQAIPFVRSRSIYPHIISYPPFWLSFLVRSFVLGAGALGMHAWIWSLGYCIALHYTHNDDGFDGVYAWTSIESSFISFHLVLFWGDLIHYKGGRWEWDGVGVGGRREWGREERRAFGALDLWIDCLLLYPVFDLMMIGGGFSYGDRKRMVYRKDIIHTYYT